MRLYQYVIICICIVFACSKPTPDTTIIPDPVVVAPVPQIFNFNCPDAPNYGDSIVFTKWRGGKDYIIKPGNSASGTYYAWPQGLALNNNTGEINVSKSETGIRYVVGFVKSGTQDTCFKKLIIGGATYVDSIYVLSNNDTLVMPFFNANPIPQVICDNSDENDYPGNSGGNGHGNNKCEFDDDDDADGNGSGDEPPPGQQANAKKVRVRTISGIINLKRTLRDGAFGSNPQNGDSKEVIIYYRLKDASGKTLQKIKVNLIFYNKRTDIPSAVVNDITTKRNQFMQSGLIAPGGKPRPPQIIITKFAD